MFDRRGIPVKKEPVVTVASVTALVAAVLALLAAFGLPLSGGQREAILGVVAVLAPLVTIAARRWVYSPATVAELTKRGPDA